MGSLVTFTMPFDITGQPAISLPAALERRRTSRSACNSSPRTAGKTCCCGSSAQLEQAAPWSDRHPPFAT